MQLLAKGLFAIVENEAKKLITAHSSDDGDLDLADAVCRAIDLAAPKLNIPGSGSSSSTSPIGKQEIAVCLPDVNVAISTLAGFFNESGVSIALCGESHRYKDPAPVEPKLKANEGMLLQAMLEGDTDGWTSREFAQAEQERQKFASHVLDRQKWVSDFKDYRNSQLDCVRAKTLLKNAAGGSIFPKVNLIVLERAMKLYQEGDRSILVKEDDLLNDGWGIRKRSALMAAYIFLCACFGADGRALVIFGEEHKDILDFFEYFATHSQAFTDVSKVRRNYCLIKSHVD